MKERSVATINGVSNYNGNHNDNVNTNNNGTYSEPPKEIFSHIALDEIQKHAAAARTLMPLAVKPETEFLR